MPCLIHVTYPQFQFIVISVIDYSAATTDIFASDILFFKRNERREKSALKFTLIESLLMRLQRDMLSNFLSQSDFFLIQYKTRKRPLNTTENFDPPTHTGEIRFLAGFEIKQLQVPQKNLRPDSEPPSSNYPNGHLS